MVAHGVAPAFEGKPTPVGDTSGRTMLQLGEAALQGGDNGVAAYAFPRPGQTVAQPKLAYVARFAPWRLVLMAGTYVDDLDAAFHAMLWRLSEIGAGILLVTPPWNAWQTANSMWQLPASTAATRLAAWPGPCWCSRSKWS